MGREACPHAPPRMPAKAGEAAGRRQQGGRGALAPADKEPSCVFRPKPLGWRPLLG